MNWSEPNWAYCGRCFSIIILYRSGLTNTSFLSFFPAFLQTVLFDESGLSFCSFLKHFFFALTWFYFNVAPPGGRTKRRNVWPGIFWLFGLLRTSSCLVRLRVRGNGGGKGRGDRARCQLQLRLCTCRTSAFLSWSSSLIESNGFYFHYNFDKCV